MLNKRTETFVFVILFESDSMVKSDRVIEWNTFGTHIV